MPTFQASATNPTRLRGKETDRVALLAIKAQLKHEHISVLSSWNESSHFCQWEGVGCSRRHQRVTVLDLQSQKLAGSISPHVGNLSFLKELYLQNNSFTGEIPPHIGHLRRLQILRLDNNSISGEIPANISSCSNLIRLDVGFNRLVGKIPSTIGSLSKLKNISFYNNGLTGTIPPSFGNLTSLTKLLAIGNFLKGSIPSSVGKLTSLEIFAVGQNMFSGAVPAVIFNISSLTVLDLMGNQFHGRLPSDMGNTLPNLQIIDVGLNGFITGPIPMSISNASNLRQFIVAGNRITGQVPSLQKLHGLWEFFIWSNHLGNGKSGDLSFLSDLANSTKLGGVEISGNNFGGMLPTSLWNFSTSLYLFGASTNQIHGSIPNGMGNLVNMQYLDMSNNEFNGSIPADIGKLRNLGRLKLYNNKLSGDIPSSLGNLTELLVLDLEGNDLQGIIPPSLGRCQWLLQLQLSQNNLSGFLTQQVWSLSSLAVGLNLSQNHLTGSLPKEVGNLKALGSLDLSDNMLSGEIPTSIGKCQSLEVLHLQGNSLQGTISSSLETLRGLQFLDLSRNNLSGKIPLYLEGFQLLNLNLSFNDFEGELPVGGVFKNASAISIVGNSKLCGGVAQLQLPKCNYPSKDSKKRSFKLVIFIVLGLVVVILVVLGFLYLIPLRKKLRKQPASSNLEKLLQVSYNSLLKATDGFSSANLVGTGSFGTVYKGFLNDVGTLVAVKVFNLLRQGVSKSFIAECEVLRNIRHRNLVKIITACSSTDFLGNDFKALVYEFMENGSLDEWLHQTTETEQVTEAPKHLNFLQRLDIAIDVASALDYLHNHCETPIVHCDLKPSNVLLDKELIGHVSDFGLARFDFGLARFLSEVTDYVSANQTHSLGLRGSIGYAAPEYGMGSEVSTYGDVYSFGILLLEMFTGKRPIDDMFKDGLNLHGFCKMACSEGVAKIADSRLLQEDMVATGINKTPNQRCVRAEKLEECLSLIFGIGIACSAESLRDRMGIRDAASELHSIRNILVA
ncbi:putative receptor-like protein kinase At3g47110 [Rosa chinensis]|uniref:putative receptor-like protein kinase At3g47110 n=1 Tax=Rosa chinensis TaxID=74649 RepID=UPI001AD8A1D2|nr:putative receptor-like protein kinase At3g47110 [Rosa chinensis]